MEKISDAAGLSKMAETLQRDAEKIISRDAERWRGAEGDAVVAAVLFFKVLSIDGRKPRWPNRDRFFLAGEKAHPVWLAAMARAGFFPVEELAAAGRVSGRLGPQQDRKEVKGWEWSIRFGLGLAAAAGAALGAQAKESKWRVYAYLGRKEFTQGDTWEAAGWSVGQNVHKLTVLASIGENDKGVNIKEKFEAFGWHTIIVRKKEIGQIVDACEETKLIADKPSLIIAS